MNNQMALTNTDEISRQIVEVESTNKMCQALLRTPHYAKLGNEGIFAIISKSRSLGMDIIEALNGGLYYVQGKVGMTAESMASLIRQKGHSIIKDAKSNNEVCTLHGKRCDNGDTWSVSFSMEDANRAGLIKAMYQKYPSIMLYNRAMSILARQLFPDIIRGAGYTPDELREIATNAPTREEKVEDEVVELVNIDQVNELKEIFSTCDPVYVAQVMTHLKKSASSIETIEEIPSALYERIKIAALKKSQDRQQVANG